jgi:hypothetical protein
MALVLCQQCLAWVEPIGEQCPQCDYPIDLRAPDPSFEERATAIGPLVGPIGPVRISRTALPDRGMLYATANGLFFVPESFERVRLVPAESANRSPRSMARALLREARTVLTHGLSLKRWADRSSMRIEISRSEVPVLGPEDSLRLSRLLMDDPGVFFLSRRSIRAVRSTFSGWSVVRSNNLTLRLKPLGDRATFHQRMSNFAADVPETICP